MSWKAETDDLAARRAFAEGLGGTEAVDKHHGQGRLTIRERIGGLCDAASFQEVGKLTGKGTYADGRLTKVVPAPYVMGLAKIDGRPVAIGGEDFTVNLETFAYEGLEDEDTDDLRDYLRKWGIRVYTPRGFVAKTAV